MLHFAGFELDEERHELRAAGGTPVRLRPKTFEMLRLFVARPGQVLSKADLMEALWPNVHVGEDGVFQCIRELRSALGDDRREMIKLVSGRGYLFTLDVTAAAPSAPQPTPPPSRVRPPGRRPALVLACLALLVVGGLAVSGVISFHRATPVVAILPIVDASASPEGAALAAGIADQLVDGLAQIDNIRVLPPDDATRSSTDFEVRGELQRSDGSWALKLRTLRVGSGEVAGVSAASIAVDTDADLRTTRLAAGAGDQLARQLNAILETTAGDQVAYAEARVAIEQASASITQTSRERFTAAETMLERALAARPENIDLQIAIVSLQTRGIQMLWYDPPTLEATRDRAASLLDRAIAARPHSIAALEAQCRLLSATNHFVESMVACAKAVSFDPWNGSAIYQMGLSQVFLGRFEDALASFMRADRYDTPAVSRWTWTLGAGWVCLLMGRNEDAVQWLQRSIAVTPASGRSYLLLAVAFHRLGRMDEAKAAFGEGMRLRPGSTAANVPAPEENTSPTYLAQTASIMQTMSKLGLPPG